MIQHFFRALALSLIFQIPLWAAPFEIVGTPIDSRFDPSTLAERLFVLVKDIHCEGALGDRSRYFEVQDLIKRGGSVNNTLPSGKTLLHLAAEAGDLKMVEILVSHGARINPRVFLTKESPLDLAIENDHLRVIQYLIDRGGDLRPYRDIEGLEEELKEGSFTPIERAVTTLVFETVRANLRLERILKSGKVYLKDLERALRDAQINALLDGDGISLSAERLEQREISQGLGDITPLIYVLEASNAADSDYAVRSLLRRGADPNFPNALGETPLYIVMQTPQLRHLVPLFLEYGADPTLKPYRPAHDDFLPSPLDIAHSLAESGDRQWYDAMKPKGHHRLRLVGGQE